MDSFMQSFNKESPAELIENNEADTTGQGSTRYFERAIACNGDVSFLFHV